MTHSFQNRLVGAVIFAAILVIFLPDLVQTDPANEISVLVPETIPARPDVMPLLVKQQTFPAVDDSEFEQAKQKHIAQFSGQPEIKGVTVGEVIETPTQAKPAANLKAASSSSLRPLPKGHAWTLQVGTFASAANVNRLLQQLSKQGWSVYTVPQTVVEGKLTRVFIGPELDQNRLKSIQKKIKETFKTKSVIVKFYPTHQVG